MRLSIVVVFLLQACSSSGSTVDAGSAPREGGPADAASMDAPSMDAQGADSCGPLALCADACAPSRPFTTSQPAACATCIQQQCAQELSAYESGCSNVVNCACACRGLDDTCSNDMQPLVECGNMRCAAACGGVD
jgi:hypothetical protein